jgi:hypothetical protein
MSISRMEARACAPEQRPLQNRHERLRQPYGLHIRSHVSKLGDRFPASRLSVLPDAHTEAPRRLTHRPACPLPVLLEQLRERRRPCEG